MVYMRWVRRRSTNAGTMLAHRRRRWANIVPALGDCLVLAGVRKGKLGEVWHDGTPDCPLNRAGVCECGPRAAVRETKKR